tara:strand:+ start:177 stop:782 length:606 start_codon:yes stop_codon:yes gene_type:complete
MALNLRTMLYTKRSRENWKGTYEKNVQGSLPKLVYNNYTSGNIRSANPIRHWRKQSSSGGTYSRIGLLNDINKPGHVVYSTNDPCNDNRKIIVESTLSKDTGCCSNEQKKAIMLTRHHTNNNTLKYGNNNIDCSCDNEYRYYHDSRSYLQRKKDLVLRRDDKTNGKEYLAACKLSACTDPDEKYFQIHGFSRNENPVNCKC